MGRNQKLRNKASKRKKLEAAGQRATATKTRVRENNKKPKPKKWSISGGNAIPVGERKAPQIFQSGSWRKLEPRGADE